MLTLEGRVAQRAPRLPAGSLFVPIAQSKAPLVMTLLEPRDPTRSRAGASSTAAFERKEYMEAYVAEDVAERC